jgi:FkbM family methyltransferase
MGRLGEIGRLKDMAAESNVDAVIFERFFPRERSGVLLEIGAARPDFLSIGAYFRAAGWRVISVEPNPAFASMHRSLNHEILEFACSDTDADDVDFVIAEAEDEIEYQGLKISAESFSSLGIRGDFERLLFKMQDRFSQRKIKVKTRRLDTILASVGDLKKLDVLAVDVEGWEFECLRGFSFGILAPKVAIIENLFLEASLVEFMKGRGYKLWRRIEPNDIYVRANTD